ncbi:prepilin-type N-terminal cleavage/methylation domain-containing protein [Candidatus Omnitrophota bacterium]
MLRHKQGFTLIELLLAVFILSFGIAGILQLFSQSIISSNTAWDLTVASSHAEILFEEMQSRKTINSILVEDWVAWGNRNDLTTLPQEKISVEMNNPQIDPLAVNVIVEWERNRRAQKAQFQTRFTK